MEGYLIIFVTFLLISVIWCLVKLIKIKEYPPGPFGLPVVGYLPWLDPLKPYLTLFKLSEKYGKIYSIQLGKMYTVVLTDPKVIRRTLAQDVFTGRADLYLTHGIMKGYGLIVAEGERWKQQRRFVLSTLKHAGMVKIGPKRSLMEKRIREGVLETLKMIDDKLNQALDLHKVLLHCMGNVLNGLIFGRRWSTDDPTWIWLQHLAEQGVKHIGVAGPVNFLPFLRWVPKFKRTLDFLVEGKERTHEVYKSVVFDQGNQEECIAKAFITKMQEGVESSFEETQMYHLLADLFGAGVDTTLTTLRWYFLFMALYPDIQKKIHEELDSRIADKAEPCLDDIPFVPFTQASLSEVQRIRPVVPLGIPHSNSEDTLIEGYNIPKGTMVVPLQWAVHMNPKAWEEPGRFNPSRFLDENGSHIGNEYFLPFQSGKRSCIGEEMAHMMLFLFGAGILYRYQVQLVQDPVDLDMSGTCGITLIPPQHDLIFTRRHR